MVIDTEHTDISDSSNGVTFLVDKDKHILNCD